MAKLGGQALRELARQIVAESTGGIRLGELMNRIAALHPETPKKTIESSVWDLPARFPKEIVKPSRGLFVSANDTDLQAESEEEALNETAQTQYREAEFYEPFAQWLKVDLDEVVEVASLGGAGLRMKWGTPDVVGVYKPRAGDLVKFPLEIVAAEIKLGPQPPIVAFGQAIAYRLFASKSYIVMPSTISQVDLSRLEALAMLFGIGLVLFDPDPSNPGFSIRVRAQRFSPDMFFVNEFAESLRKHDPDVFERLFR